MKSLRRERGRVMQASVAGAARAKLMLGVPARTSTTLHAVRARKAAETRRDTAPTTSRSNTRPPAAVFSGSPQAYAASLLGTYGWDQSQMTCLVSLWNRESGWRSSATNASSGAYGIPQSLPGSKMASAGADWRTNPATQIRWGLGYIKASYGSPCGAWGHSQATGWY